MYKVYIAKNMIWQDIRICSIQNFLKQYDT